MLRVQVVAGQVVHAKSMVALILEGRGQGGSWRARHFHDIHLGHHGTNQLSRRSHEGACERCCHGQPSWGRTCFSATFHTA